MEPEAKPEAKVWFVRRISKIGKYYVITIPKDLADLVIHGERYIVTLEPATLERLSEKMGIKIKIK